MKKPSYFHHNNLKITVGELGASLPALHSSLAHIKCYYTEANGRLGRRKKEDRAKPSTFAMYGCEAERKEEKHLR
jgi:hypothetical protein